MYHGTHDMKRTRTSIIFALLAAAPARAAIHTYDVAGNYTFGSEYIGNTDVVPLTEFGDMSGWVAFDDKGIDLHVGHPNHPVLCYSIG